MKKREGKEKRGRRRLDESLHESWIGGDPVERVIGCEKGSNSGLLISS